MKITVLGANGKTGVELVRQALAAGYSVVGVVRHEGSLEANPNLSVVVGDVTDPKLVAQAAKGSDVILSTLGSTSNRSSLMTDAVKAVIEASETTGYTRFILMSSFAVEGDRLKGPAKVIPMMIKGMLSDKTASENLLRASDLDWTIVYATRLTTQPKGSGLRVIPESEKIGMKHKIARADVAAFMLEEALKNTHLGTGVTISQ